MQDGSGLAAEYDDEEQCVHMRRDTGTINFHTQNPHKDPRSPTNN